MAEAVIYHDINTHPGNYVQIVKNISYSISSLNKYPN